MSKIQPQHLTHAIRIVDRMTISEKSSIVDALYIEQPILLASVAALSKMGTSLEKLDVLVNLLLIIFEAMRASGKVWAVIDEDTQERCLARVVARIKFTEGLPEATTLVAIKKASEQMAEPHLFGFVVLRLMEHGVFKVQTDADKYFVMAALNLVECLS